MEALKPIIEDTSGTNVTLEKPSVPDLSENAVVFARSLSRLLEGIKEDKIEMPSGEVTPVETPIPAKVDMSTADEIRPPPNPVVSKKRVESVVDTALPTEAKAFLDTISLYEARDYDIIVGEGMYGAPGKFTDYSKHPNVIGMRTVEGPSTAAGRYQFVYSTWQELQKNYPGQFKDFSPITQDRAAWRYAQDVYKQRTGRDLTEALRSGNIKTVQNTLRKIWIGFGLDKNVAENYAKALGRYTKEETIIPTSGTPSKNTESTPLATDTFGVPVRVPFPSEDEFFKANPNVAGMAAEDNKIILNPYSKLSTKEKNAVMVNESARVYMRTGKVEPPQFDLTPEQEEAFKDYSSSTEDRKATVAARILSGDPSALKPTPEQLDYVKKLRVAMRLGR